VVSNWGLVINKYKTQESNLHVLIPNKTWPLRAGDKKQFAKTNEPLKTS